MSERNLHRLFVAMTALLVTSIANAQNYWEEDFEHNNAALYTNLNGGPDNLTISGGMAMFSGVEGTYYGRTDLLIPSFTHPSWHFVWSSGVVVNNSGPIGFGWYSPVNDSGMSVLLDQDTLSLSLIEHQGFNNATVLETVTYETPIWGNAGKSTTEPLVFFNWDENTGWTAALLGGDPHAWFTTQVHAGVLPTEDMHFLICGWESATYGSGVLDRFGTSTAPEPGAFAAMVMGIGFIAVRGPSRKRRRPAKLR